MREGCPDAGPVPCLRKRRMPGARRAFSLVEIVLAVGIISIALLAIFGLFGTSLRSNNETISQHEVLGISRSLTDFLESTNSGAGFTNVFNWVKNTNSAPGVFSYVLTNGQMTNALGTDPGFDGAVATRSGRLFRSTLSLSPNMPLRRPDGTVIARPSSSDLPATADLYTNEVALPVQVRIYSVASSSVALTNLQPVFTYETAISR